MPLVTSFASQLDSLRLPAGRALVAVSGGLDSVVLLDLLVRTRDRHHLDLIVAHADHGIQPVDEPRALVTALATRHGLRLVTTRFQLGVAASETTARAARMRWLRLIAREEQAGLVFLAHHADDQAETVLMRLLRGSGPAGLAGMQLRRGMLVRPLLPHPQATLEEHARTHGLEYWNDPTNRDPRHLRSWIRHRLLPTITDRLPDANERLTGVAAHAARGRRAWHGALHGWPGLLLRHDTGDESLTWTVVQPLAASLRAALVQAWLRERGCRAGPRRISAAIQSLEHAQSGAAADLGNGWRLELAFDRLRVLPPAEAIALPVALVEGESGNFDWGSWSVRWATESAPARQERAGPIAWFIPGDLSVRSWRPGDRVAPLGGRGHRLVVRCFQDAEVPFSDRANWPVLTNDEAVTWIPGVCRSDLRVPEAGSSSLRVEVRLRG